MGEFDDHGSITGDQMAPSPSSRSFFSLSEAVLGQVAEPPKDDNLATEFAFHGPDKQSGSQSGAYREPNAARSRSSLVERMAARAGYNAPRLNTDDADKQSSHLMMSHVVSPTTLLESPVFISNSLAQSSPTTGKLASAPPEKDNLYKKLYSSLFAFRPAPESAPAPNKIDPLVMSRKSEHHVPPQTTETTQKYGGNEATVQEHNVEEADKITNGKNNYISDDGYGWSNYGQKEVKGGEYLRSYYKCTHADCPVKKKVGRSHEGQITDIIYNGAHNHPKPPLNRRSGFNSSSDIQGGAEWGQDGHFKVNSVIDNRGTRFESSDPVDSSLAFSNDEGEADDDDRATHGDVALGYDGEGDESKSKRRKGEAYAADVCWVSRAIKKPRVVVQTMSDVDILDDGYSWLKYGKKVLKGNPNPRNYYKCKSTGCVVRKHVERASHDHNLVITAYEGIHNHEVPIARNNSRSSTTTQAQPVQPSRAHNTISTFDGTQYGLQPGPHGYDYGVNLAKMNMYGSGPNQANMADQIHPFSRQINETEMIVPNGEPKANPVSDPGLNLAANGPSGYHHQVNRLPHGPQM